MPPRRRQSKRKDRRLAPVERGALMGGTVARLEYWFESLDEARSAWDDVRSSLMRLAGHGQRPAAFWIFEAPERLHPRAQTPGEHREVLSALDGDYDPMAAAAVGWRRSEDELARERIAWLREQGLLTAEERAMDELHVLVRRAMRRTVRPVRRATT